jgi:hypothetical protein
LVKTVDVLHKDLLLGHLPLISNQSGNEALVVTPIGDHMKILSACVTLDRPLESAVLPPIFLLHPIDGKELILEVVTMGPPFLI